MSYSEYLSNGKVNKMWGQSSVQQAGKPSFVGSLEMVLSIHALGKDSREASSHHNLFSADCRLWQCVRSPAGSYLAPHREEDE